MDNVQIITRLLKMPSETVDPAWVKQMLEEHPTFIMPALLLLKRSPQSVDDATRQHLQSVAVLNCADRTALVDYVDPRSAGWATFYPESQPHQVTTEETIDDFLQTFGHSASAEEEALLERLLFNPVAADYFSGTDEPYDPNDPLALPPELRQEEEEEEIQSAEGQVTEKEETRPEKEGEEAVGAPDESLLMESLAKIFIKQRRYERAFEIISKLSLNYPEKSVYFADQLRFLQKLIINQQYQSK